MKKPLLTAKEFDLLNEFSSSPNLQSLNIPKLIDCSKGLKIEISETNSVSVSVSSSSSLKGLTAKLTERKVLNKDLSRPIYYYNFIVNEQVYYEPGDSFGFYPELANDEVEWLGNRLGFDLEEIIKLTGSSEIISALLPGIEKDLPAVSTSVRKIVSRLDIKSFPRKALIRTLAEYCQDEKESQMLLFLSSRSGSDAYNRLRTEMLSVQVLLAALDSLNPTLEALILLVGPLQPRYYSCCRMKQEKNQNDEESPSTAFQIVFNVTGVCSKWLESLSPSKEFAFPIQKRSVNNFRLTPSTAINPIIMIAAGTGVAPFIGFLEVLKERQMMDKNDRSSLDADTKANTNEDLSSSVDKSPQIPLTWLIYGFRNRQDDFIFEEELSKHSANGGILTKLSLAISRDPIEPKLYVQDLIFQKEKELFSQLIFEQKATIYICGDELTMIKGVNDVIVKIIMEKNPEISQKEAEGILLTWTKENKINRDIWI